MDPEILLRESAWVAALARSLVRDSALAEDVVQDTWLAALRRPPEARERGQVRAFLATIVRRIASSSARSEWRRKDREREGSRPEAVAPESEALERLAVHRALANALSELREPYRTPVAMRYVEGLAPREIALRLQRAPETVRSQISRGLEMLRERLDREHGGDRHAWCLLLGGLEAARTAEGAVMSGTLAGGVMGFKFVLVAAAALVVAAGWWKWRGSDGVLRHEGLTPSTTEAEPREEAVAQQAPAPADSRAIASTPAVAEESGPTGIALRGQVVSALGRRPLPGAFVEIQVETQAAKEQREQELKQLEARLRSGERSQSRPDLGRDPGWLGKSRMPMQVLATVECDGEGRFELASLPPDDGFLVARAERHVPTVASWRKLAAAGSVVLELAPAGVLDVQVVDTAGDPVEGVWISVQSKAAPGVGAPRLDPPPDAPGHGPSDASGRVNIASLPAGIELALAPVSGAAGSLSAKPVLTTIDPSECRGSVRLVLATAGALTGVVVPPPLGSERIEARFLPWDAPASPASANVDAAGRFLFEHLPAGRGSLEISTIRRKSRATRSTHDPLPVKIIADKTTDLGSVVLPPLVRLAGQVSDWEGASSNDFLELRFLREGRAFARTTLDSDGRFEAWLAPGPCAIEIVHLKQVLGAYAAAAPDEDCKLDVFAFCAGLRGRVPRADESMKMFFPMLVAGDPSADGWLVSPDPAHGAVELHAGAFRMLLLEPGRHCFLAWFGEKGGTWIPSLDLQRGRELDLGRLECGFGLVEGRVIGVAGVAAIGAEVVLDSPFAKVLNPHAERRTVAVADGGFRFEAVAPGPWRASVLWNGSTGSSEMLDVQSGGSAHTDILLACSRRWRSRPRM